MSRAAKLPGAGCFSRGGFLTAAADGSPAWIRRIARSGLLRGIARRLLAPGAAAIAKNYGAEVAAFNERMRALGVADIERYCWYHSVDLPGNGSDPITTPGFYDYRKCIGSFQFPADMRGLNVLDVGSATGYFAFEFEKRGAAVVSVDLPSLAQLDRFPGQDLSGMLDRIQRMNGGQTPESPEDLYYYLLEAPFRLCARLLGSRIERCYCTVYELSPELLSYRSFDYVFAGDILVHTLRPFDALAALARVCSGTLVIAQFLPGRANDPPAMVYVGGEQPEDDDISWWLPNERCLIQLLRKLGFAEVRAVGNYEGLHRPAGNLYSRRILHATRPVGFAQRWPGT